MKILPRTQFGNPILRAKAKTVPAAFLKTAAFRNLVKRMFFTMNRVRGVGLAAPQIGKSMRLAVIGVGPLPTSKGSKQYLRRVLVNPKIVWHSPKTNLDWEGCLSFPDVRGTVPRWDTVKVEYTNEKGERIVERCAGYLARIFQHEIDHLNGYVYVDRMKDMRTLMTHKEFMARIVK